MTFGGYPPGRNDPCPCGSGKKWKRCHGNPVSAPPPPAVDPDRGRDLKRQFAQHEAKETQRVLQQGRGRPIISTQFQGRRVVAVGGEVRASLNWLTFHDFLLDYIKDAMGREWGAAEFRKADPHPLMRLARLVQEFKQRHDGQANKVKTGHGTGAVMAYLGLAYNLYLLKHNAELQQRLVNRLRNRDQFWPAMYETFVAALLIRAGFSVTFENEADASRSHCEFTAVYRVTGRAFSVEAAYREPGKSHAGVSKQLRHALEKRADHERIVFIELNVGEKVTPGPDPMRAVPWLRGALDSIRKRERSLIIDGHAAPPAYVVLTNQPFWDFLDAPYVGLTYALEGFKIPEVRLDFAFTSIREGRLARDAHREIHELLGSMGTHNEIPVTFEGEIPEFAFGNEIARLVIGRRYVVPGEDGAPSEVTLDTATVDPARAQAICGVRDAKGVVHIATFSLSAEEVVAYQRYPDTFFGVPLTQGRHIESPLELYDFFFKTEGRRPKENILQLMGSANAAGELAEMSQEDLAVLYCERLAEHAFGHAAAAKSTGKPAS